MVLDNQQDTQTAYIAGLFEGEGSILMNKLNMRQYVQYRCNIQFTNTEVGVNKAFIEFLKSNDLHYHVRADHRKDRRICYQITITRTKDKIAFIEKLKPYFVGIRKEISDIALKFLSMRMKFIDGNNGELRDKENGRFKLGTSSFTEEYEELLQQYIKLRESSETTCRALVSF